MPKIITFDIECTNDGPDGSPEAHWEENKVLCCGHSIGTNIPTIYRSTKNLASTINDFVSDSEEIVLVGHNLKFDLKYLMRDDPWIVAVLKSPLVSFCDTMYSHYRQTGHFEKFISLEELCKYHSITYKKSLDLGAFIDGGGKMSDIESSELRAYLMDDVIHTRGCYYARAEHVLCPHLGAIAEMELVGLPIDKDALVKLATAVNYEVMEHKDNIERAVKGRLKVSPKTIKSKPMSELPMNYMAPRTLSYILTGEPSTGLGTKANPVVLTGPPMLSPAEIAHYWPGKKPTHLGYPMPENIVSALAIKFDLFDWVSKYRKANKTLGTYINPALVSLESHPHLHPSIHLCSTNTGRSSSSKPNGQNMPPCIRELVMSTKGTLMEIDLKQLEMVAVATISGDPQLIFDINHGVDVHYETGKTVMKWTDPSDMTEKTRKLVKNVNFGILYGGGPQGLSHQTGQSMELIKKLIKAFFTRYPRVLEWQEEFYTQVTDAMIPAGHLDGEQIYNSIVKLPCSGRLFKFTEKPSPLWLRHKTGRGFSFKPTETKNYPVQGFAGGDIVMSFIAEFWILLLRMFTIMRLTVHDSILIDTALPKKVIQETADRAFATVVKKFTIPTDLEYTIYKGSHWK